MTRHPTDGHRRAGHRPPDPRTEVSTTSDPLLPLAGWLTDAGADVVRDLLREMSDPELGLNIVDLGLAYDVTASEGTTCVGRPLTRPGCPLSAYYQDYSDASLGSAP